MLALLDRGRRAERFENWNLFLKIHNAEVAELVDALVSNTSELNTHVGSIPTFGTYYSLPHEAT